MDAVDVARPLAMVAARLTPLGRGRLLQILPESLGHRVGDLAGTAGSAGWADRSFVEEVLAADLDAAFADRRRAAEDEPPESVLPLKVSDVMAAVLGHASSQQAAEVLLTLPPALQTDVLHKVVVQDWPMLVRRLGAAEMAFMRALDGAWSAPGAQANAAFAADVLRHVQATGALRRLLTGIYRLDPESTGKVQGLLYGFEGLVRLTDLELQAVMTGVDQWDLVLALRTASQGLRRRVMANISERRAEYLVEDEAVLEGVDMDHVYAVQHRIVTRVRQLYEAGKIHTYLGSVAGEAEAGMSEEAEAALVEALSRDRRQTEALAPFWRRWHLLGVGTSLAGVALAALIFWWSGLQFTKAGSGGRRVRGLVTSSANGEMADGKGEGGSPAVGGAGRSEGVALAQGEVYLVDKGAKREAEGETVRPGDTVETGEEGRTVIRLEKGQVQVEPASSLQVGDAEEKEKAPTRLSLRLGHIWVYVKHPGLEVRSPLAQVTASEGALYQFRVVLDATTTVSVQKGTVWARSLADPEGDFLVLGPGEGARLTPRGRFEVEEQAPASGWLGLF